MDKTQWIDSIRQKFEVVRDVLHERGCRDWAAKGTMLLGIRAVIASSFERIHRGNLIGMGVLPLQLHDGVTWQSLGLTGEEIFDFQPIPDDFVPGSEIWVSAVKPNDENVFDDEIEIMFPIKVRIDTPVELVYYLNGGIMPTVIRKLAR